MARHTLRVASVRLTFASAAVHARQGFLGVLGKTSPREKVAASVEAARWQVSRISGVSISYLFFKNSKKRGKRGELLPCHVRQRFSPPHFGAGNARLCEAKRGASGLGGHPHAAARYRATAQNHPRPDRRTARIVAPMPAPVSVAAGPFARRVDPPSRIRSTNFNTH